MNIRQLTVSVGGGVDYPVFIGAALLTQSLPIKTYCAGQQVLIITNDTIGQHYLKPTRHLFHELNQVNELVLPDGEAFKTLSAVEAVMTTLIRYRHNRTTTLVALGGGVISDITGFAAAIYQRGVDFIVIPTSLLAQVDAAVGGKTAVNHPLGKNMLGAFHQPRCILADIDTLRTLSSRDYTAGLAEVVKYALLADADFFHWLCANQTNVIRRDEASLLNVVERCLRIKANIVAQDEKEQGSRALLNLGHTFAHALEKTLGFGVWHHGEAVAVGLVLAASLSNRLGLLAQSVVAAIVQLLNRLGLPTRLPHDVGLTARDLWYGMQGDKKSTDSGVRFVLLTALGEAKLSDTVPSDTIIQLLEEELTDDDVKK